MMKNEIKPAQIVRLKPELWALIDAQAEKEERSRNKMIELLIRRGMGEQVQEVKVNGHKVGSISFDPNKIKI